MNHVSINKSNYQIYALHFKTTYRYDIDITITVRNNEPHWWKQSRCASNPRPSNYEGRRPKSYDSHCWILHLYSAAVAAVDGGGGVGDRVCSEVGAALP